MSVLAIVSLMLFTVILIGFNNDSLMSKIDIKTLDIVYKALTNFVFVTIAGVFLY